MGRFRYNPYHIELLKALIRFKIKRDYTAQLTGKDFKIICEVYLLNRVGKRTLERLFGTIKTTTSNFSQNTLNQLCLWIDPKNDWNGFITKYHPPFESVRPFAGLPESKQKKILYKIDILLKEIRAKEEIQKHSERIKFIEEQERNAMDSENKFDQILNEIQFLKINGEGRGLINQHEKEMIAAFNAGQFDDVEKILRDKLSKNLIVFNTYVLDLFQLAVLMFQTKKFDAAIKFCNNVISYKPNFSPAYYIKAFSLVCNNDLKNAFATIENLLQHDPFFGPALLLKGRLFYIFEKKEYYEIYFELLQIIKNDKIVTNEKAIKKEFDNINYFIDVLSEKEEKRKIRIFICEYMCQDYSRKKLYETSLLLAEELLKALPENIAALECKMEALHFLGRIKESFAMSEELSKRYPRHIGFRIYYRIQFFILFLLHVISLNKEDRIKYNDDIIQIFNRYSVFFFGLHKIKNFGRIFKKIEKEITYKKLFFESEKERLRAMVRLLLKKDNSKLSKLIGPVNDLTIYSIYPYKVEPRAFYCKLNML